MLVVKFTSSWQWNSLDEAINTKTWSEFKYIWLNNFYYITVWYNENQYTVNDQSFSNKTDLLEYLQWVMKKNGFKENEDRWSSLKPEKIQRTQRTSYIERLERDRNLKKEETYEDNIEDEQETDSYRREVNLERLSTTEKMILEILESRPVKLLPSSIMLWWVWVIMVLSKWILTSLVPSLWLIAICTIIQIYIQKKAKYLRLRDLLTKDKD